MSNPMIIHLTLRPEAVLNQQDAELRDMSDQIEIILSHAEGLLASQQAARASLSDMGKEITVIRQTAEKQAEMIEELTRVSTASRVEEIRDYDYDITAAQITKEVMAELGFAKSLLFLLRMRFGIASGVTVVATLIVLRLQGFLGNQAYFQQQIEHQEIK